MKFSKILLFASAAILPVAPAFAQDAENDIVVVASGIEQPAAESGRAVTVIGRDDLDRVQAVNLADTLATLPGISVTRNGGLGGFSAVRIRGAEGEQTLVLIDGVRVNDPSSPGGGYDFGNLLAGAIDRVEVLRGPNSTVWGSQAIGGVVNVITASGSDGFGLRAGAEGGSFGTYSGNAAIKGGNDRIRGSLTAGYFHTDGISAAANGTEADGFRQYGATGRVEAFITPEISVDLRGYFADSRAEIDGFPAPTYTLADTAEYAKTREIYGYAGLNASLFDGVLENQLAVTVGDIDRNNYDPAAGTAPVFFGKGSSERYLYRGNLRIAEQFRLVVGVEHEDSRFTDGTVSKGTAMSSYFVETIIRPSDYVTVNGGVRQDEHRDFGSHSSFSFSGSIRPNKDTVVRLNWGEGFKAPTLYQLYGSWVGNANLKAETAESYEIGIDQQAGPLRLSGTLFHRKTVNQIDYDAGTFSYGNIARTRSQGYEVEAELRPVTGLILSANYTHIDPENQSPGPNKGNDLARRPRDAANFGVDFRTPFDLSLGASVQLRGDSFDNAANTVKLEGVTLVNIRAEYPISERFSVYGRVDNLFDEQYQVVAGYGTYGRAAYVGLRVKLD